MNTIESLLSIGDRRTTGHVEEVIKQVLAQPGLFERLITIVISGEPASKMRAFDAIEKISRKHPQWLQAHKSTFLTIISKSEQKEVRWHLAQILPRLNLTPKEQDSVFNLMLDYLEDDSRIVKTFAMQALTDLAILEDRYFSDVLSLLKKLEQDGVPSQQSRARKLLKQLQNR